jgi:pyruvate carboxylase subunit B
MKLGEYFESITPKYRDYLDTTKFSVIDTGVLWHHIPGGMFTNMVAQLKEANALDKINEVYAELPRLRKELGYPPLVTPTSQIVGTQAIQNVLFGRYKMISAPVKDYCFGLYGQPPAPIDPEVQKLCLKGYKGGEKPITVRPGDILPPEMEKAKEATKDIAKDIGDVLVYALYPITGMQFLKWKYGLETPPESTKPKTLEEAKKEEELIALAKSGKLTEKAEVNVPAKGPGLRTFNVYIGEQYYKVEVEGDGVLPLRPPMMPPQFALRQQQRYDMRPSVPPTQRQGATPASAAVPASQGAPAVEGKASIKAPLPGIIVRCPLNVGDSVNAGDVVIVIEAMKMENELTSPINGKLKALLVKPGEKVDADTVLAVID